MHFTLVKAFTLVMLLGLASGATFSQKTPTAMVQVESFSIEQGLSDRSVNFFAKDQQGFFWVGTDNGLSRFDGYDFLTYDARPQNKRKLRFNKINTVNTDRAGNLLVRYKEPFLEMDLIHPLTGEVTKFNFDGSDGFTGKHQAMYQAPDGAIFFLALQNNKQVIYQLDEKTLQAVKILEVAHPNVNQNCFIRFLKAADGTFWFAYNWAAQYDILVVHTDANGRTIRSYGPQDFLMTPGKTIGWISLTETIGREIWFTLYTQGVYIMDTSATGVCKRHPQLTQGGYLFGKDKKGNLLAYQNKPADPSKGCYLITSGGQIVDYSWVFKHQAIINEVFSDDFTQGLLASSGNGFNNYQLRPQRFKTFLDQDLGNAPYGKSMRGIAKLGKDQLFIGTELDGIYELDLRSNVLSRPGDKAPALALLNELQYPRNLVPQGDSVLWVSGLGGVLKYSPARSSVTLYETKSILPPTKSQEIWGIVVAKTGRLWLLRRDGMLLILDPGSGKITPYQNRDGSQPLMGTQPSFLFSDRAGTLWVGTSVAGLVRIDPEKGESRRYSADPGDPSGLNSNHITCIYENESGLLWLGTMEGGLDVFNPRMGRVEAIYSRENGLRNNSTVGILPDIEGNFWVSTFSGLAYLDTKGKTFRNYTTADGLSHNEFNRFSYFFDPAYGRFYFGGMNGVNAFDQKDQHPTENDAPLLIAEMSVAGQHDQTLVRNEGLIDGTTIVLAPGSRFLHLSLALGTDHNADANQFSYQIAGLDKDWNYLGTNRNLRIDYLPAGDYILHLRGADDRGNWSTQEIALHLVVQEFWYKRWWAYLLYVTLFVAGSYYFYRFQLGRRLAEKETQRLQQLDAFKTRFFTNISHEFRTPLTVILGMVEPLKKYFGQSDSRANHDQAAEMVRRNSQQLLTLVNQLLDLSRLEAGKLNLSPSNGDLTSMLQYQLDSFHSYAETRHITLHFHSDRPQLEMAFDQEKIQSIFANLISNALKFTPEGGQIHLQLRTAPVEAAPAQVLVEVRDTGIGIPEDQLDRIFDRFYQVDDSTTSKVAGTGVGLALVQELVKLMQGSIAVESKPGHGTTFRIVLPYTPPQASLQIIGAPFASRDPIMIVEKEEAAGDDQRPLLLLVEDNPDVRFYIAECVRYDYRVVTAGNGAEGIEKAIELVPDIIISDVMMPEKDGFELCETLKSDERTSHIPIVLLTARADFDSRIAGLKRGADDYLAKPFEPEELQVRLDNLVRQRRRLQQRYAALPLSPLANEDPALVLEDAFLLKIREVVEANLSVSDFEMPQLEQALGMSRSQVFRKVKALTGGSPSILIRSIRLHKAKELLRDSRLSIAEVAYEVGFSAPSYFATTFLEAFGKTPSEWRQS